MKWNKMTVNIMNSQNLLSFDFNECNISLCTVNQKVIRRFTKILLRLKVLNPFLLLSNSIPSFWCTPIDLHYFDRINNGFKVRVNGKALTNWSKHGDNNSERYQSLGSSPTIHTTLQTPWHYLLLIVMYQEAYTSLL